MSTGDAPPVPAGVLARLRDRAEELVYRLNERNHWLFRIYDLANEAFAAARFAGLRRRAGELDVELSTRGGLDARLRMLGPADDEIFAELLARLDARYLPPHPLDRESARRALRRRSYLPFGIFVEGRLVGYLLVRLFLPGRAVTGIWTLPQTHNLGLAQETLRRTGRFTHEEGIPDYCTVPIDNVNSVRTAHGAGFVTIRTNRRFHVLKRT